MGLAELLGETWTNYGNVTSALAELALGELIQLLAGDEAIAGGDANLLSKVPGSEQVIAGSPDRTDAATVQAATASFTSGWGGSIITE